MKALASAMYHAGRFDNLPSGTHNYTSVFVSYATEDTEASAKNYQDTNAECVRRFMCAKVFDFVRDDPQFAALQESFL